MNIITMIIMIIDDDNDNNNRVRVKSTPRHTGGKHKQFFHTVTQEVFKEDKLT